MTETLFVAGCFLLLCAFGAPAALWLPARHRVLAAPGLGIATLSAVGAAVAFADVPIATAVPWCWLGVAVAGALSWRWRRRDPGRGRWRADVRWLGLGLLAALVTCGWAYVLQGHRHYFGFANPDGWSYVVAGEYLRGHRISDLLGAATQGGGDPDGRWTGGPAGGLSYWLHPWLIHAEHALSLRLGQYCVLGFVAATFGLRDVFSVFVPLSIALVAAIGASLHLLARAGGASARVGRWAHLLAVATPLVVFGVHIQFFSQTIGLALLPLLVALHRRALRGPAARFVLPLALAWSGLWTSYPELIPFTALAVGLTLWAGAGRRPGLGQLVRSGLFAAATALLGLLPMHVGVVQVMGFVAKQFANTRVPSGLRPGEGVFDWGASSWVLAVLTGTTCEPLIVLTTYVDLGIAMTASVVAGAIAIVLTAIGWLRLPRLRLVLVGFMTFLAALYFYLAFVERYPYAAAKTAMFGCWTIPLGAAAFLGTRPRPGGRWALIPAVLVLVVAPVLMSAMTTRMTMARPPTRLMNPRFNPVEDVAQVRELFPDAATLERCDEEGVMLGIRDWNDALWGAYWLRDIRLGLFHAQSYLSFHIAHRLDHECFHARGFRERWLVTELRTQDVLHRTAAAPVCRSAAYGRFEFADFVEFEHGDVDGYPHPRLRKPHRDPLTARWVRDVWTGFRLRVVRPGPEPRRLRCRLAPLHPVAGPGAGLELELKVDGKVVETLALGGGTTEFVSQPLPLAPDGVHAVELGVRGVVERAPGSPADFSVSTLYVIGDEAFVRCHRAAVAFTDAEQFTEPTLSARGIDGDCWLHEQASFLLRVPAGHRVIGLVLEVPGATDGTAAARSATIELRAAAGDALLGSLQNPLEPGRASVAVELEPAERDRLVRVTIAVAGGLQTSTDPRLLRARLLEAECRTR